MTESVTQPIAQASGPRYTAKGTYATEATKQVSWRGGEGSDQMGRGTRLQ